MPKEKRSLQEAKVIKPSPQRNVSSGFLIPFAKHGGADFHCSHAYKEINQE